jgi:hypothetical protein
VAEPENAQGVDAQMMRSGRTSFLSLLAAPLRCSCTYHGSQQRAGRRCAGSARPHLSEAGGLSPEAGALRASMVAAAATA